MFLEIFGGFNKKKGRLKSCSAVLEHYVATLEAYQVGVDPQIHSVSIMKAVMKKTMNKASLYTPNFQSGLIRRE